MVLGYTETDQERAEQAARRGFFGQCAVIVAAAVCPERVWSFGAPQPDVKWLWLNYTPIQGLSASDYIFSQGGAWRSVNS